MSYLKRYRKVCELPSCLYSLLMPMFREPCYSLHQGTDPRSDEVNNKVHETFSNE